MSFMSPKPAAATPPPPPPSPTEDPSVKADMERAAKAERNQRGRAATILTGGRGLQNEPASSSRVLLG